jgi:ferredoxin-NADP reductase
MRPGGVLHARRPAGTFVYPEGDDRALVLIAGGVGITPMISMLRHGLATEPQRPFTLLHAARQAHGLAFADELRVLARRWPSLQWVPVVSGQSAPAFSYPGRIDAHLITSIVPSVADALVYMCGPTSMIDGVRETLLALRVPDAQIRFERFEAAIAAVGAHASAPAGASPPAGDTTGSGAATVVTFARSCRTHRAGRRDTLLEAAEACGVAIPSLCRAGVCGTCRTRVADGDVRCDTSALGADERADGYVLACVAHAASNCTVEA